MNAAVQIENADPLPAQSLERHRATWLAGVVLTWGVGLAIFGASDRLLFPDEVSSVLCTWAAYSIFYGYSRLLSRIEWSLLFAPLPIALPVIVLGNSETREAGVVFLVTWAIWLGLGYAIAYRRLSYLFVAMFMGALGIWSIMPATSSPPGVIATCVLACLAFPIAAAPMICVSVTFVSCGAWLRCIFCRQSPAQESLPARWWPAQFTLRDMFYWTTWLAVIFAVLGLIQLSARAWVEGTLCSLAGCVVAYAVIRFSPAKTLPAAQPPIMA